MPYPYTKAVQGERLIRFRIRNCGVTTAQGTTYIVSPYKGRIKRALCVIDGNPTVDWIATISTPNGSNAMGLPNTNLGGNADIGESQAFQCDFNDQSEFYVDVGDVITIDTLVASGTGTSLYGWLVIQ